MHRIFCCRSRRTSRVEVDEITDSLERCLLVDRGVVDFSSFLKSKSLHTEKTTLDFAQNCQSILTDLSRLSPHTRETQIPERTQNDIENLCTMAQNINFDLDQMNTVSKLQSADVKTHEKMLILQNARSWAIDELQLVYNVFKKEALRGV